MATTVKVLQFVLVYLVIYQNVCLSTSRRSISGRSHRKIKSHETQDYSGSGDVMVDEPQEAAFRLIDETEESYQEIKRLIQSYDLVTGSDLNRIALKDFIEREYFGGETLVWSSAHEIAKSITGKGLRGLSKMNEAISFIEDRYGRCERMTSKLKSAECLAELVHTIVNLEVRFLGTNGLQDAQFLTYLIPYSTLIMSMVMYWESLGVATQLNPVAVLVEQKKRLEKYVDLAVPLASKWRKSQITMEICQRRGDEVEQCQNGEGLLDVEDNDSLATGNQILRVNVRDSTTEETLFEQEKPLIEGESYDVALVGIVKKGESKLIDERAKIGREVTTFWRDSFKRIFEAIPEIRIQTVSNHSKSRIGTYPQIKRSTKLLHKSIEKYNKEINRLGG